jgi:hypothetical protein
MDGALEPTDERGTPRPNEPPRSIPRGEELTGGA